MAEMVYLDTRGLAPPVTFRDVLLAGTAPGGGLYDPEHYPLIDMGLARRSTYPQIATHVIFPYVQGIISREDLDELNHEIYTKAVFGTDEVTPIDWLQENFGLLELSNGPTLAFKDLPMLFVARLMDYVLGREGRHATVIVSTSGDTGGAAVKAFAGLKNVDLVVLFPKGRVSSVQQRMMTTSGASNVHALAVEGNFDDCQDIVKVLFDDKDLVAEVLLSAVNSINWARIMAQIVYWTACGVQVLDQGFEEFDATLSSGNFGNAFSLYGAQRSGVPVRKIIVATNQNDVLYRTFETGKYTKYKVNPSTSPSMDIQVSSNFERLLFELSGRDGGFIDRVLRDLKKTDECDLRSVMPMWASGWGWGRASEPEVMSTIKTVYREFNKRKIDPHTAVGIHVAQDFLLGLGNRAMIVAETARPEKFPDAVGEALGIELPLPPEWADLSTLPERIHPVGIDAQEVRQYILDHVR